MSNILKTIQKFESFVLGVCKCGCGTNIEIRSKNKHLAKYCKGHNMKKRQDLIGKNNGMYKNGGTIHGGYSLIKCRYHPRAKHPNYYVREHIIIMEKHLGRYLTKSEVIHHIDKNKMNNKIENLMLFRNHSEHKRFEMYGNTYRKNYKN